jgi:hypothetical protein
VVLRWCGFGLGWRATIARRRPIVNHRASRRLCRRYYKSNSAPQYELRGFRRFTGTPLFRQYLDPLPAPPRRIHRQHRTMRRFGGCATVLARRVGGLTPIQATGTVTAPPQCHTFKLLASVNSMCCWLKSSVELPQHIHTRYECEIGCQWLKHIQHCVRLCRR